MRMLKELDPVATEERRSRQLKRRRYKSGGPNNTWHADGYGKLKPYGLPIHGAIDGFLGKYFGLRFANQIIIPLIGHAFLLKR